MFDLRPCCGPYGSHMGPYVFVQKCYVSGSDGSVCQNNDWFLEISEASIHPRPAQSQKLERQIIIFLRGSAFITSVTFRVQTAPFDKITIDFCRSRRRLHDSDLPGAKNPNIWPKIPKIQKKSRKILKNQWIPRVPRWRPMWRPINYSRELVLGRDAMLPCFCHWFLVDHVHFH